MYRTKYEEDKLESDVVIGHVTFPILSIASVWRTTLESSDTWGYENVDESAWDTNLILIVLIGRIVRVDDPPCKIFPHDAVRSESVKFTFLHMISN